MEKMYLLGIMNEEILYKNEVLTNSYKSWKNKIQAKSSPALKMALKMREYQWSEVTVTHENHETTLKLCICQTLPYIPWLVERER